MVGSNLFRCFVLGSLIMPMPIAYAFVITTFSRSIDRIGHVPVYTPYNGISYIKSGGVKISNKCVVVPRGGVVKCEASSISNEIVDVTSSSSSSSSIDKEEEEDFVATSLPDAPHINFSHVHMYVDRLERLEVYKDLECTMNHQVGVVVSAEDDLSFVSQARDVVKQLICGLDFRVTGTHEDEGTRSMLVTSKDPNGVKFVVSAKNEDCNDLYSTSPSKYSHFSKEVIDTFYDNHIGRQGFAVLAFVTDGRLESIRDRYHALHPGLVIPDRSDIIEYADDGSKVFEVYAYYSGEKFESKADHGTVLRFIESSGSKDAALPGIRKVSATFSNDSQAAYCDHWVSNVISRTGFIETLQDTLNFQSKVDFNAGVVAAGEAQIESTVSGNSSPFVTSSRDAALKDQSQVYLPINNALSSVGHVHGFIEEIGQGVQHIASRVEDLIGFIENANNNRKKFGEGFTFLNIPRSYYGVLTPDLLSNGIDCQDTLPSHLVSIIIEACRDKGIIDAEGAVELYLSEEEIMKSLDTVLERNQEYFKQKDTIVERILLSRYVNLYKLLRDGLTLNQYLGIVENKILVDVQGHDMLFQIFTSNVLQRKAGDESPFFEFIQRVCFASSIEDGEEMTLRPGCGGFGIRNFLTLFLSIEVSKAMRDVSDAILERNDAKRCKAEKMVSIFTDQLNESNPILTQISDAMTEEGEARILLQKAEEGLASEKPIRDLVQKIKRATDKKNDGNERLLQCSSKYMKLMKDLREE